MKKFDYWNQVEMAGLPSADKNWKWLWGLMGFSSLLAVCLGLLSGCVAKRMHPASALGIPSSHYALNSAAQARLAPAGSRPSLSEEVWVIAKGPAEDAQGKKAKDEPGSGAMLAKLSGDKEVPLPLKHTAVHAGIEGYIAVVEVTQQFHNPYSSKIEAVYKFPLPHNAAVTDFTMTIGDRRIRGIIRERAEAEKIYQEAKQQGYVASLLTQERPNIFSQSVANIEPGKQIDVHLQFFNTLAYADGGFEWEFPMVVGPRFNPPGTTEGVGAVARGAHGISGQSTEVQYLKPNERSGHDIALTVDLDARVSLESVECRTHRVDKTDQSPSRCRIVLHPNDRIPNKDFVLRYRVAGAQVKSDLLTVRDERSGYFALTLYPPQNLSTQKRQPLEMVFVLDCSGSMSGRPLEQVKLAIDRALRLLEPEDTFQIIRFSDKASPWESKPVAATPANVQRGQQHLASLNSEGGTMMITGIRSALDFPHDPQRLRFVCFMTDGYIGNETEILGEIHQRIGASRIFSFGVGSAVNRYLLEHMAKAGRGAMAYLGPQDSPTQLMDAFVERISHPALTDLRVDWGDLQPTEVYPQQIPDLFVGRMVLLTGRFSGSPSTRVNVTGRCAGETVNITPTSATIASETAAQSLPSVWARARIADLADQMAFKADTELAAAIKKLALDYNLLSAYTAFVAVDASVRTAGDHGTTVPVAVPVPDGVRYDTTVQEKGTPKKSKVQDESDGKSSSVDIFSRR